MEQREEKEILPEINEWPGTAQSPEVMTIVEPTVLTGKYIKETNRQRKNRMTAGVMVCHYCRSLTNEPLRVEREQDGKRMQLENFGKAYYHKSCKVQSLMNIQLMMENPEETSVEYNLPITEPETL